jgi:hypothetical protein
MLFYPADLVDYARAQYTPAEAIKRIPEHNFRKEDVLRVEGGQPCTREGWWWSPADNEQKARFFKVGEITPIITSKSWGQSYWLWHGVVR